MFSLASCNPCACGCGEAVRLPQHRWLHGHHARKHPHGWTRAENGCWVWNGAKSPLGYGRVSRDGRWQEAHRVVYEDLRGPIPKGLSLDHLCRNPSCVNPDHLEPVTHRENLRRGKQAKLSRGTAREVAAAYGVSETLVWNIRHRDAA